MTLKLRIMANTAVIILILTSLVLAIIVKLCEFRALASEVSILLNKGLN